MDRGCKLSGRKCGTNMEFRSFFLNSSMNVCVQHCLCNNESFVSNRKSCTNRNFILVNNFKNRHEELKKKKEEVSFSLIFQKKRKTFYILIYFIFRIERIIILGNFTELLIRELFAFSRNH